MILPFSTHIDGKPTYFVEKIWGGLIDNAISNAFKEYYGKCTQMQTTGYTASLCLPSKIHTIREDKNDRWKVGNKIHFTINNRTKNSFQFAPVIPVKATQEIFMTRRGSLLEISIAKADSYIGGDDFYADAVVNGLLSQNDGFNEYEDFRNFFCAAIERNGKETGNYWFKGKIIHWTDFKY